LNAASVYKCEWAIEKIAASSPGNQNAPFLLTIGGRFTGWVRRPVTKLHALILLIDARNKCGYLL